MALFNCCFCCCVVFDMSYLPLQPDHSMILSTELNNNAFAKRSAHGQPNKLKPKLNIKKKKTNKDRLCARG